jgi:hypothetical protein
MHLFTSAGIYHHRAEVCEKTTFPNYIQHFCFPAYWAVAEIRNFTTTEKASDCTLRCFACRFTTTIQGRHMDFGVMTVAA